MQTIAFLIMGIFLVVFQTTVLQLLPSWFGTPDLVFILVAFISYRFDMLRGLLLSFALGWMMDVVSGFYLGIFIIEYVIVFLILNTLTKNSPIKESAYQIPLVGISYLLAQLIVCAGLTMAVAETLVAWSWGGLIRETVILTAATIPCFILFNSLYEFMVRRKASSRIARKKAGNRFR